MGDGGKSLNVAADQSGEHFGLGFAQLREFFGHVGDRAVVLAHLRAAGGGARRSGIAVESKRVGENLGTFFGRGGLDQRPITVFEFHHAVPREGLDRGVSPGALEVVQRSRRQGVIGLIEMVAARVGDREDFGRTATTAPPVDALFTCLEDAIGKELVKVTAHCGRCEMEPLGKVDRRGRSLLQNRIGDPFTGRRIVDVRRLPDPAVFHNTILP